MFYRQELIDRTVPALPGFTIVDDNEKRTVNAIPFFERFLFQSVNPKKADKLTLLADYDLDNAKKFEYRVEFDNQNAE